MKKLIILAVLLMAAVFAQAQDFEQTNFITVIASPGSLDDGESGGIQYEYQNRTIYIGAELYIFPDLHGIDYTHLIGRVGLNQHFGKFSHWGRLYSGIRMGFIRRAERNHALLGLEAGIDIFIPKTDIYIRLAVTSDMKADSQVWSAEPHHTVNSGIVGIGIRF